MNIADVSPILQAVYDGEDVPATRVTADRIIWLVDHAAAPTGTY